MFDDPDQLLVREVPEHLHALEDLELERDLGRCAASTLGAGRLADADDDGGDVVVAAALVRDVDELLADLLDLAVGELLGQLGLVDVGVHAVGAHQEAVAGQDVEVERVDLDRAVDADGARDRVLVLLVRRALDLLAVELAAADQLVHQRVVLGEHVALVLAREVDAAVADVRDEAAQVIAAARR